MNAFKILKDECMRTEMSICYVTPGITIDFGTRKLAVNMPATSPNDDVDAIADVALRLHFVSLLQKIYGFCTIVFRCCFVEIVTVLQENKISFEAIIGDR